MLSSFMTRVLAQIRDLPHDSVFLSITIAC